MLKRTNQETQSNPSSAAVSIVSERFETTGEAVVHYKRDNYNEN